VRCGDNAPTLVNEPSDAPSLAATARNREVLDYKAVDEIDLVF